MAAVTDLNVTLQSGVNVTGLAPLSPNAVDIFNQSVAPTDTFVVMENGAIINVTNVNGTGLHLQIGAPGQQLGAMPRLRRLVQLLCKAPAFAKMR